MLLNRKRNFFSSYVYVIPVARIRCVLVWGDASHGGGGQAKGAREDVPDLGHHACTCNSSISEAVSLVM